LSVPVGTHLLISNTTAPTWTSTADNSIQSNYKNELGQHLANFKSGGSSATQVLNAISYFAFSGHGIFAT
jgi:hypothetical protein